jgi:hypothetical protein
MISLIRAASTRAGLRRLVHATPRAAAAFSTSQPVAQTKVPITVAHGDGIGPEIMASTLNILDAAGAAIEPEVIEIGQKLYRA